MSVIQPAAKVKDAKMLADAKPYLSHDPTDPAEEPWAIVLLASDIAEITPYLGLNVANREDLIARIKMLSSLRLDNTDVIFEPALLTRLKSRCLDKENFGKWLGARVKEWACSYVGM